jgi:hypothetical protein
VYLRGPKTVRNHKGGRRVVAISFGSIDGEERSTRRKWDGFVVARARRVGWVYRPVRLLVYPARAEWTGRRQPSTRATLPSTAHSQPQSGPRRVSTAPNDLPASRQPFTRTLATSPRHPRFHLLLDSVGAESAPRPTQRDGPHSYPYVTCLPALPLQSSTPSLC